MTKYLSLLLIACLPLISCGQSKVNGENDNLIIDKNIKSEVEKHIEDAKEFDAYNERMLVYKNSIFIEAFENDKLVFSSKDNTPKQIFKSFYLWRGDTLKIDGAFGLFGGFGFAIDIVKNKAVLYHMLSSDDFPTYCYNIKDSLISRLEVPCSDTKIILSEIPDSTKTQVIYGYVEFKSGTYYQSAGSADGKEILPRTKQRDNMKIFFKSSMLVFPR
jgi:hypothetical protein